MSIFRAVRRRLPPRCTVLRWRLVCWSKKIHARQPGELDDQPTELLHPNMVQPLRVRIDREARRLAGYRYGRQIADDYMRLLGQGR